MLITRYKPRDNREPSLLADGRLRRYLGAALLGRLSYEMFGTAVVLHTLARTDSAAAAGAVVAAATLPSVVLGPVLGVWLDRTSHRRAAIAASQAAMAMGVAALGLLAGRVPVAVLVALALLVGPSGPMLSAGYTSLLPSLAAGRMLDRANGADAFIFNVAAIAGPAVAGGLAALAGTGVAVACQVAIACCSTAATAGLPEGARVPAVVPRARASEVLRGLRYMLVTPLLRESTVATTTTAAAVGLLALGFPLYAQALGAERAAAGWMWAALAAGSAIGTLFYGALRRRFSAGSILGAGLIMVAVCMGAFSAAPNLGLALLLVGLAGVADGPALAALFSVRQQRSPQELMGQVFLTGASMKIGAYAVGAAVAAPLLESVGVRATLLWVATAFLVSGLLAGASALRHTAPVRTEP